MIHPGSCRIHPPSGVIGLALAAILFSGSLLSATDSRTAGWSGYGGDLSSRHSPLRQINRENVARLRVAWTYHTGDIDAPNYSNIECAPLVVDDRIYLTSAFSRVIALEAATGREIWKFHPFEGVNWKPGAVNRGVAYWSNGMRKRIVLATYDGRLISLDARTGQPDAQFGAQGIVNLRAGIERDLRGLKYGATSPPVIFENLAIVGFQNDEGPGPSAPGDIRAFDMRNGREVWRFHTVPRPGEFGHDTWAKDSWKNRGGANAWAGLSVDAKRGLVFAGLGSAAFDIYGGDRQGANLFANCVLALDARTGKRRWHYQTIRHDLWDYDLPFYPLLVTVRHQGRMKDAVAQITKTGFVFVLDRETGKPLFEVVERPVPTSDVPGEEAWPTQPAPVKPPPFIRQTLTEADLTDISKEARDYALERFKTLRAGRMFTPVGLRDTLIYPGLLGGGNWSGACFDPATGLLYVNSNNAPWIESLKEAPAEAGYRYERRTHMRFTDRENYPAVKPPWGNLTAIDLNRGEIAWQATLGKFAELTARGIPPTGTENFGGAIVTAGGLVFIGSTMDEKFRAFDKSDGKLLWEHKLAAGGYAAPATYSVNGRQYVVIAAGGGGRLKTKSGDAYVAFALPLNPGRYSVEAKAVTTKGGANEVHDSLYEFLRNDKAEDVLTVNYPASSQPGELAVEATYRLWIPPGVKRVRAVITHQHGCGEGAERGGETAAHDLQWRELAARHDAALLGPRYNAKGGNCRLWSDPRLGSGATFPRALSDLAKMSGHPELASAPWCLWGHSGGGFWVSMMLEQHAPRIVAVFCRSGSARMTGPEGETVNPQYPPEAFGVPVALNPGTKERGDERFNRAWEGTLKFFEMFRAKGAPVVFAPDPISNHDCRNSRLFAIPFFDACLRLRLPAQGGALKPVMQNAGLLGDWQTATTQPVADAKETLQFGWLPDAASARAFSEYVKDGVTTDATPPVAPVIRRAAAQQDGVAIEWTARADFESGVREFVVYRDGQEVIRIGPYPRAQGALAQFQGISYHDTPLAPLAEMKWVDVGAANGKVVRYEISAINGAGLESPRSRPARVSANNASKTARRTFGPLRVSTQNPRYFSDARGKVVYLTGSHTWPSIVDMSPSDPPAKFDYPAFLDFLDKYNHNFTRLWTWESVTWDTRGNRQDRRHTVAPLAFARTGPGNALDGKPKFDLTKYDAEHFRRLRERVRAAQARGIYVSVMLFEGWNLQHAPGAWEGHPFNAANNVNGIDGDKDGDGKGVDVYTLASPAVTRLQEAYVRKLIDTVNDLDNVMYEISNENFGGSTEWQYHFIRFVKDYERAKPARHPVGMTFQHKGGTNQALFDSPADWISPNPEGGYKTDPPDAMGRKVILNDTDHLWGTGGEVVWLWQSFCRGLNPLFMDPYDGVVLKPKEDPRWEPIRRNLGFTRRYAERMQLDRAVPSNDLASSGYCLANPGREYLVYLPSGGKVSLDLAGATGKLKVEWMNPADGKTTPGGAVEGARRIELSPPFAGPAVLFVWK